MLIVIFCCRFPLTGASRQTTSQSQGIEQVKAAVRAQGTGEKAKVIVRLRNHTTRKGCISSIGEESFTIVEASTRSPSTIAYADVLELKKQGLSKAAKWSIFAVVWVVIGIISGAAL